MSPFLVVLIKIFSSQKYFERNQGPFTVPNQKISHSVLSAELNEENGEQKGVPFHLTLCDAR